jgi:oxygen-independent coproporphyrinogen-3 oxidase
VISRHFENWSLDLIFGAPPVEAWAATVAEAAAMGSPHISAYGLTYEPGTPFEKRRSEAVDDETSLAMYHLIRESLDEYDHYEISNFAKPGYQCLHHLIYWYNGEYAGFGPGAYSFLEGVRARNVPDVDAYLGDPGRKIESLALSDGEIRVETVIQHLRLREGLREEVYAARFGRTLRADFGPQLEELEARGILRSEASTYRPTALGYDLNNEIGLALVLS